jgi:hypothetical protein
MRGDAPGRAHRRAGAELFLRHTAFLRRKITSPTRFSVYAAADALIVGSSIKQDKSILIPIASIHSSARSAEVVRQADGRSKREPDKTDSFANTHSSSQDRMCYAV